MLRSAYQLFKDTPARREDYTSVTGSSTFPLKIVAHRWVENVRVLERVIDILPSLKQYVKSVESWYKIIRDREDRMQGSFAGCETSFHTDNCQTPAAILEAVVVVSLC